MGKTILVVDKTGAIRGYARLMLGEHDIQVNGAVSCQIALASCERHMPDVVLLDMQWPEGEMGALDCIKQIRALPGGKSVDIICTSSVISDEERESVMAADANEYLAKPYTWETLSPLLKKLGVID